MTFIHPDGPWNNPRQGAGPGPPVLAMAGPECPQSLQRCMPEHCPEPRRSSSDTVPGATPGLATDSPILAGSAALEASVPDAGPGLPGTGRAWSGDSSSQHAAVGR